MRPRPRDVDPEARGREHHAMSVHLLAAARAAYRVDGSDAAWLGGILAPLERALGHGAGGWIATYDRRGGGLSLETMAGLDMFRGWRTAMRLGVRLVPREHTREALDRHVCATLSGLFGASFVARQAAAEALVGRGVRDALGLNARDSSGAGVVVALHLREPVAAPADREGWEKVAAHIAAGARLRRALADGRAPEQDAEAILERDGRVAHLEPAARGGDSVALLRRAALALGTVERARGKDDARAAIDVWEGLVDGRWTMLDHFDRDGRRYFVARKNDPAAPRVLSLTGRQRQVVALAALGHTNKLIAYELGIGEPAVSRHLQRAAERVGATFFFNDTATTEIYTTPDAHPVDDAERDDAVASRRRR